MRKLLVFIFCLIATPVWATTYYVDQTSGSDSYNGQSGYYQSGSIGPWKTIGKVNGFSFSAGDDVYFKCGETWTDAVLNIDWDGTALNRTIVGAYYMEGTTEVIGVSGTRPTIDGQQNVLPPSGGGEYQSLVKVQGSSTTHYQYITIQNIRIINSQFIGLNVSYTDDFLLENVEIYRTGVHGLTVSDSNYPIIQDNIIHETVLAYGQYQGFITWWNGTTAYEGTPGWPGSVGVPRNEGMIFRRNRSYDSYGEGISTVENSRNITIEYNEFWNTRSNSIYIDDFNKNSTVRYNLCYVDHDETYFTYYSRGSVCPNYQCSPYAIRVQRERGDVGFTGNVYIYGNFIADYYRGIEIADFLVNGDAVYVYNNTVASTFSENPSGESPIRVICQNSPTIVIKNNIFSSSNLNIGSPSKATWDYNLWSTAPPAAAQGSNDPGYSSYAGQTISLSGDGSWDSLAGGNVDVVLFYPGSGSDAVDAGVDLGTPYNILLSVADSDYRTSPMTMVTLTQSDYGSGVDIGATPYTGGYTPPPPAPGSISRDGTPVDTQLCSSASSCTVSRTIGSGSNRYARISVYWRSNVDRSVSSVVYDPGGVGTSATSSLTSLNASYYTNAATYYVLDSGLPTAGTHDITVTMDGSCYAIVIAVETFTDVYQAAPEATQNTDDTDGNGVVTSNITTLTDGAWLVDTMITTSYGVSATAGTNQSEVYNSYEVGKTCGISSKQVDTAGSSSMSWTVAGSFVEHLVEAIAPASIASPAPTITDIGTLNGGAFDDAQTLDIGIGESVYILFALSEQIINLGNPTQSRVVYQVDYPASTDFYGAYVGQVLISATYYLEYEIRGGYTWDGISWVAVNAMREMSDLAISSIDMGQATMRDGDGNDLNTDLGANTDPGTITISCPGIIKTTDPTAESLLDYDKVVLLSGSAAWTPTEDYLTIYLKGTYSGDITLTGVSTPCRVINPGKATGTNNWGSCTQHNQFPPLFR